MRHGRVKSLYLVFFLLRLAAAISTLCSGPCFILECKANLYQCFSQNFIIPRIPNFILTFLVIFTSCMIAALVSNIGIVLSITGCLCGSQICYLFPSVPFFLFLHSKTILDIVLPAKNNLY